MKPKNLINSMVLVFLLITTFQFSVIAQTGNIVAPVGTPQIPSDYIDNTIPDDPVFIFCSPDANGDTLLGQLSILGGYTNCIYEWKKFDTDPSSSTYLNFAPFLSGPFPTGSSSTISNLASGFYMVHVTCNPGLPNESHSIKRAHVFVNESIVDFDAISAGCSPFTITGANIDGVSDFTIYDPPQTPFIIDTTTSIEVCIWADHSYVSDLGFYLHSPSGAIIDLLPPVPSWNQGSQITELIIGNVLGCDSTDWYTGCNSGNDIQEFCFTSGLPAGNPTFTPCICDMPTPLTGDYASCEEWTELYGENTGESGWALSVYDCVGADIGSLQKVTLSFQNSNSFYNYDSGAINVSITDGACDPVTATLYEFPVNTIANHEITNEVTAEWSSYPIPWEPAWGSQDYDINPNPVINPQPASSTSFCLTINDHLYDTMGIEITNIISCEPQRCRLFETLPSDPTILNPPTELCTSNSPIQLTPLYYGGAWTSSCGSFDPVSNTGCITGGGLFFPENAPPGPNYITYATGGVCGSDTTVIINILDAPQISNIQETANMALSHYQVCFEINGGFPGTYTITETSTGLPAVGTLNGNTWCSDWLPINFFYTFTIDDINSCDPQTITGFHNSTCTTNAGIMPSGLIEACAFDVATSIAESPGGIPSWTMDANDGYEYYLHTNQLSSLGTVLDHNTTGTFTFNSSMVYGQTYYISQVVGNNIGTPTSHLVDLSDPCLSVSVGTPVMWYEFPTSNAGMNDYACGLTTTLNADTPSVGTGSWTCLSVANVIFSPSFTDPGATAIVPNFDTNQYGCQVNTDYTFRWTVTNGPCEIFDDVTITFKPQPIANAGTDITVCGLQADMNAEFSLCGSQGISQGTWIGDGSFSDINNPLTEVAVFQPGAYTFIWTEWNDECESLDYITVNFYEQPLCDAGYNDSVCGSSYNLNAISTVGTGMWTGPLVSVFADPTSPNTSVQVMFIPGQNEVVAEFTWTESNAGLCFASDNVTIVFSQTPTALAGLDDWTCGNSYTLDADILGSTFATGTWITNFAGANFTDNHDPNSTLVIPNTGSFPGQPLSGSFGDSSYVTVSLTWDMNNNNCVDQDDVNITFYQTPLANAGDDFQVCGLEAQLAGDFSIGSSVGKWIMVSGPSSIPPSFSDDTDPHSDVTVSISGEYVFEWQEKNIHNQTCMTIDEVIVNFREIPNSFAGPDKMVCGNKTTLDAVLGADIGFWVSTTPNHILDGFDPNSVAIVSNLIAPETFIYIWNETNEYGGLQCNDWDSVQITYVPVPDITIIEIDSGDVELTYTGGIPPFDLIWSNGETDMNLFNLPGGIYYASLTDSYGCITVDTVNIAFPFSIDDFESGYDNSILFQNIPNPFRTETEFNFYIHEKSNVKLSIYDILGNEIDIVVYNELPQGKHSYNYSAVLPPGTYFYRMETDKFSQTKKMVVTGK